jgi:hypothetical protein
MKTITEELIKKFNIEIEGMERFYNEFDIFFANTNLSQEDRAWLLEIIKKIKNE